MDHITSRIQHTKCGTHPDHIVLVADDIEAANSMNPEVVISKFEQLLLETIRVYPWTHLVLVVLTETGNARRRNIIQRLNALMQHIASDERLIMYTDNHNSSLKDGIHLTYRSKVSLGKRIATIIQKPHLDVLQKFR